MEIILLFWNIPNSYLCQYNRRMPKIVLFKKCANLLVWRMHFSINFVAFFLFLQKASKKQKFILEMVCTIFLNLYMAF